MHLSGLKNIPIMVKITSYLAERPLLASPSTRPRGLLYELSKTSERKLRTRSDYRAFHASKISGFFLSRRHFYFYFGNSVNKMSDPYY